MKRIFVICLLMLSICVVNAKEKENKLSFTQDGKELVYDSALFDENIFMNYPNMLPGVNNTDILSIENNSNATCELYFKILDKEYEELSDELLNNIHMVIFMDDEIIYEGNAKGEEVKGSNVDLKNVLSLGTFKPGQSSMLKSATRLSDAYDNGENTITSIVTWQFYAQCADEEIVPINPDTSDFIGSRLFALFISVVIISLLFMFYSKRKLFFK